MQGPVAALRRDDDASSVPFLSSDLISSLGIDWSQEIQDTPSGRVYEYTPKVNGTAGYYTDIAEMFNK